MSNGKVFTEIAGKYDKLNAVLSLGRDQAWRRSVVRYLPPGRLLDLGAGTGAANPVFGNRDVVSLDPSPEMLALNPNPDSVIGVGEHLPFDDGQFDSVFSAYVFRNLDSVDETMAEVARVLRSGGVAGILDLGRPQNRHLAKIHRLGTAVVLPLAGMTIGAKDEYSYLHHTLDKLPQPEELFADGAMKLQTTWRLGPLGFVYAAILVKP
ncbi:MAG: class I SAM-dependent methyltransferase [Acidimicrobiia bacterium]|nr:class I SAM-dependent methyltransferase [Acidimicrobiia bacterium]